MKRTCGAISWCSGTAVTSTTCAWKRKTATAGNRSLIVVERRVVRTIRYEGNKSATVSDILERFKERKVGLSVESRYDPTRVQRAVIVLRELLGERGRQYAKVTPDVRQILPRRSRSSSTSKKVPRSRSASSSSKAIK